MADIWLTRDEEEQVVRALRREAGSCLAAAGEGGGAHWKAAMVEQAHDLCALAARIAGVSVERFVDEMYMDEGHRCQWDATCSGVRHELSDYCERHTRQGRALAPNPIVPTLFPAEGKS